MQDMEVAITSESSTVMYRYTAALTPILWSMHGEDGNRGALVSYRQKVGVCTLYSVVGFTSWGKTEGVVVWSWSWSWSCRLVL